jgi:ABC-type nickel/cobalt efflux system permease component RcnA
VLALGLAGGMVPSASALIVLLVALTTGEVALGMLLIVAFGIGMATVLGSLAVGAAWLQARIGREERPGLRRVVTLLPLISGLAVLGAGALVTLQAVARLA